MSDEEREQKREDKEMREWVARENREKKRIEQRNEEEKIAKRVRLMQEREYTEEDNEFYREAFGEYPPDNKRKEEGDEEGAPGGKRRRTQEEEDWYDDFWTDEIGL
eukprot:6754079-Karenia_brevis.AAC.1